MDTPFFASVKEIHHQPWHFWSAHTAMAQAIGFLFFHFETSILGPFLESPIYLHIIYSIKILPRIETPV